MKKTHSRRDFVSTSLKGLAGIGLLGLVGYSKKELEGKFWETKEYSKTLKKIYQLAKKIRPKNSSRGNHVIAFMRIRDYDDHEHNPDIIDENEDIINPTNYHLSLHALKRTLRDYEAGMEAIKRREETPYVKGSFYKH